MNSAHKATNEKYRSEYDRIFNKRKGDKNDSTRQDVKKG